MIILSLTVVSIYADEKTNKANDYIAHCNFALGISLGIGGDVNGSHGLNITLTDDYNDVYNFNYNPNNADKTLVGFNILLSLPFYYQNHFSVGIYGQALLNWLSESGTLYYGGGLYGEGIYKQFSLKAGLGVAGINMSKTIDTIAPAWSGDPGYYTGSKFIEPGEKLTASSYDFLGFSWNVALKYYPFKNSKYFTRAIFLEIGYFFFPGIEISDYKLKLNGTAIDTSEPLPLFKVDPIHNISLLIGIGL